MLTGDEPVFAVSVGLPLKGEAAKARKKAKAPADAGDEEAVSAAPPRVIGYAASSDFPNGTLSAAAVLAARGDGIYVSTLDTGEWWFACIRNGVVVPSTDVLGTQDTVLEQVRALQVGLSMEVLSAVPGVPGGREWDLQAALRRPNKSARLRRISSGKSAMGPVLIAAAVVGCLFVGYRLAFPPTPKLTPEQQQALARQAYIQAVQGVVKTLPTGAGWVAQAYANASAHLPPFVAGWTLEGVACDPMSCKATYAVPAGEPFALSPMQSRFGAMLSVLPDGHSVEVTLPVSMHDQVIDESYLRRLRPSTTPLLDWVGRVPLAMPGASVSGQLLERHLDRELGGAAAAMPPLVFEQVSIKGEAFLSPAALSAVLIQGSRGSFAPVQVAWSYGLGNVPAAWRMTWERIHG